MTTEQADILIQELKETNKLLLKIADRISWISGER